RPNRPPNPPTRRFRPKGGRFWRTVRRTVTAFVEETVRKNRPENPRETRSADGLDGPIRGGRPLREKTGRSTASGGGRYDRRRPAGPLPRPWHRAGRRVRRLLPPVGGRRRPAARPAGGAGREQGRPAGPGPGAVREL